MKVTLLNGKTLIATKIQLPNNREALFNLTHITLDNGKRATKIWFRGCGFVRDVTVEAICSFQDNFCKKTGRKIAAQRLMERLVLNGVSKTDRAIIFRYICPEYFRKELGKLPEKFSEETQKLLEQGLLEAEQGKFGTTPKEFTYEG